ncbi:MAG TPA: hypothetical protein VEI02_16090, partial [Planctomycetota bacterium]|nr:hypothetical protein [Planctomycetota bacterium]
MKLTAARSLALVWAACAAAFALRDVAEWRDVDLAAAAEPWRPFADAAVGEPDDGGEPEPEPWVLLAPRHRETSPSPPIVVLTPGYDGPIRLSVRLTDGRAAAWSTPARTAPWPAALTPVEVGVAVRILAEGPGGRATASFLR